jgi:hypothetical protein
VLDAEHAQVRDGERGVGHLVDRESLGPRLVGERLADLELSARAIQVLSSIYYKLNEEN